MLRLHQKLHLFRPQAGQGYRTANPKTQRNNPRGTMKTSVQITRAELNTAMEHFFARGGFIERIETEPYAKNVEGYPGLVIAGPMLGDWLHQCVEEWLGEDTSNSAPEGADLNRFSIIPDFSTPDC